MIDVSRDYALQERIVTTIAERPFLEQSFEDMVAWDDAHAEPDEYGYHHGWTCQDVATHPAVVTHLLYDRIVKEVFHSRSRTTYQLISLDDTKEALAMIRQIPTAAAVRPSQLSPSDMFGLVIGQERPKAILRMSLDAEKPVHVLLVGPPGCAKTLMLEEIANLPESAMYTGGTTTKSGLVGMLIAKQPRRLVLDELNTMSPGDMTPLLTLMQSGRVTRLQHRRNEDIRMETVVYAGANDLKNLTAAIKDRFEIVEIPNYSKEEFRKVAKGVLTRQESVPEVIAELLSREVSEYCTDIRKLRRIANMINASDPKKARPQDLPMVLGLVFPKGAVSPIRSVK